MKERRASNQFPRTADLPYQSPKYWAKEKNRYLRQLLISDIEAETERETDVYFSRLDQAITEIDADDMSEVLSAVESKDIDILLHTPGGLVDAVEKFVSVLSLLKLSYRVVVPSFAKSGGTLIALTAKEILMGVNSELGPVDPQITTADYASVSAEYVVADDGQPKILQSIAKANIERGKKLAEKYIRVILETKAKNPTAEQIAACEKSIATVLEKLCSPTGYGSHGAVIDYTEAHEIGLPAIWMDPNSTLWKKVWLLYFACMILIPSRLM